ncbi:nephrin-like [Bacillus rossius redtenbacheri]|uniref:nephrin-like n=1 Tax=Bacillus rossius redtenbacheri TaxID=93214 RepID=UPI002FDDF296
MANSCAGVLRVLVLIHCYIRILAQGPAVTVQAVVSGTALLPCDISAPAANDSAILVIWYKNDMTPIYSYDVRGKHSEGASHWKDKDVLEGRAYFRTITEPATLSVDGVDARDEGDYRCRVDYKVAPTKNTKVKLVVITPPQTPKIFSSEGREVHGTAGPYEEGGDLRLTCIVSGGRPLPSVRWWREEGLVDSTDAVSAYQDVKHNVLTVKRLERSDLHARYTCQASNNNISQPVSASVVIDIYFKPLSASILHSNQPLSADRKYEIVCISVGSRPPAKITWWLDNRQLDTYVEKVSQDENVTTSTLTLTPTMADHDKSLTCRAENARVRAGVEEDTWKLDVFFMPIPILNLGSNLNPDDIEEGDDVYFECKVHANPWAYKIVWKHNGQVLQHNQRNGVIMNNMDLALQSVKKTQSGNYSCIASNVEGDGVSNIVQLNVMYKPLCRAEQKRVYGVARHENANVVCEVDSYPPPDTFKWAFNNTAETIDVPQARYRTPSSTHSQSTLTYTPVTEMDYGTVMCWAFNTAGQQVEPCVFHIIATGRPDPPFNCTLLNQTTQSLEVDCLEGFDGGQPQLFLLEASDAATGARRANLTASQPQFSVAGLGPGSVLRIAVYAFNAKGRSDAVQLEGFTLKVAEKQTGTPVPFELRPVLGYLIGVASLLLVAVLVAAGALWLRAQHKAGSPRRPLHLAVKEKALPLRSDVEDLCDKDDRNPDVVPCNKDSDYQLMEDVQSPAGLGKTPPQLPSYDDRPKCNSGAARNGDLTDNYKAARGHYPQYAAGEEVTYAELCLPRPTTLLDGGATAAMPPLGAAPGCFKLGSGAGAVRCRDEPTIYAQIDHGRLPYASPLSPLVSPPASLLCGGGGSSPASIAALHPLPPHREIVTVRTPLMTSQQESCV